jgi:hypothetical protein
MIPSWVVGIGQSLAEFLITKLIDSKLIDLISSRKVKKKIDKKIRDALTETITDSSDAINIFENFNITSYLDDMTVQSELSSMIGVGKHKPDIEKLENKWLHLLGNQLPGHYRLIINKFIRKLEDKLWEINEIRDILHYREQRINVTKTDENTRILDELRRLFESNLGLISNNTIHITNIPASDSIPLLSSPFVIQEELLQTLLSELSNRPWLALIDGPGKGKTQLAVMLAREGFSYVKWISLRNAKEQISSHFRDQVVIWLIDLTSDRSYWELYLSGESLEKIAEAIVMSSVQDKVLIIDDLPDPVEFEGFYFELEIIAQTLVSHGVRIITTGQRALPPSIENRFHSYLSKRSRPSFSQRDILFLLNQEAAPSEFMAEGIVTWILAITKGHPSLVAATLKWLSQSNWDYSLTLDGLMSGEPVKETLEFSRRSLIRQLSESEKELLYRCSIVGGNFSRLQAIKIANINPKLSNPGSILDYLIGPWLEQLENQEYNVTPLLVDSGKENLSFEVQQAIHRLLVRQITEGKVIGITKVFSLLMHLWQAQDYLEFGQVLLQAMMTVKTASQARYINWAASLMLDIKWPDEIDLSLRLLIRAAQIRLAMLAGRNIDRLNTDLELLIKQANPEDNLSSLIGVHLIAGILIRNLPAEIAIHRSFSLLRLYVAYNEEFDEIFGKDLLKSLPVLIVSQGLLVENANQIFMFLEEINKLNAQEKTVLLHDQIALEVGEHLMNLIPFSESKLPADKQNWNDVLAKLDDLAMHKVVQENLYLKISCARARSIVFADYLKNVNEAIKILDTFSDVSDPEIVFFLNYAKGCYLSVDGQVDNAIVCFLNAQDSVGDGLPYYRVDNTRRLAIEKSKNKDWKNAKELCITTIRKFSLMGLRESRESNLFIWDMAEMLGELAFIYWNLGDLKKVSTSFYGYVMKLVEQEDINDLRYKEAFNKAGHGLGWFVVMGERGSPPSKTLDGEIYAPVTAGIFGVRREALGTLMPPLGFSKALLLYQVARALYVTGLERLAWSANKMALKFYKSENQENNPALTFIYSDTAVLEMTYGDESVALSYVLLAVRFWAGARKSTPDQSNVGFNMALPIDFSSIAEDDLKVAERQLLYLFFAPVLLNCLSLHVSEIEVNKKISAMEKWLDVNRVNILYHEEWLQVIAFLKDLLNYQNIKIKPNVDLEVFGDRTTFQIIWLFVSSLYEKIPLKESFTNQVSALAGLASYGSFCTRMLPGFGRLLHQFWLNVSKTQRFALHDPRGFAELMNSISPSLGGRTIIKVVRCVSVALQTTIPTNVMQNLEGLIYK